MLKLTWNKKLFDTLHFFSMNAKKNVIGWYISYRYRMFYIYSLKAGVCLCVKRKQVSNVNTSFFLMDNYKKVKVYLDISYFLNGMYYKFEKYNIANKLFKCSRLSKKRISKV